MLLTSQQAEYLLDVLFNGHRTYGSDWSDLHTGNVMHAICREKYPPLFTIPRRGERKQVASHLWELESRNYARQLEFAVAA